MVFAVHLLFVVPPLFYNSERCVLKVAQIVQLLAIQVCVQTCYIPHIPLETLCYALDAKHFIANVYKKPFAKLLASARLRLSFLTF